ncbi:patatin-like phospholipase family protein [Pseudofrankia sp. BMG5.36]|uniref:patatin-like phospholipase family protein n=1 Tax=Pseudofrankia sp. BMG5.36 TaxID=1834512 RepID=UPI0008D906E8|nr:patatin-like phospholipase family protein [Pseudofrankia sp. BMG5.36]OHV50623.1 patatin [Pseudofrankia sp. BMG5.36]
MPRKRAPRRGLVLGAGGVLGSAWMIGALRAYQAQTGDDARSFDLIVGTSAGSVVAALLSLGVGVDAMADSERGLYEPGAPILDYRDLGASLPPPPRMRMGSPRLLTSAVLHPRRTTPMVALAALLPQGRGTIAAVGDLVASAAAQHAASATSWPRRLRVVAMDFDTGARVLFGANGAPKVTTPQAVMASCAIPGWYAPVTIGGRRFVDGGTRSPTSLDLCMDAGLDEILVLAPACAFDYDRPRHPVAIAERQLRRAATRRLAREIVLADATGTSVYALSPGREDLEVMGGNVMDVTRRAEVFETALRTCAAVFADRAAGGVTVPEDAAAVTLGPTRPTKPRRPTVPATAPTVAGAARLETAPSRRTGPVRRPAVREEPGLTVREEPGLAG